MKFLRWFLKFFGGPRAAPRRPKFLEGTEWLCPKCKTTIAIARCDMHYYEIARSSEWDIKDPGFWSRRHCGEIAFKYNERSQVQILTPTGWVG